MQYRSPNAIPDQTGSNIITDIVIRLDSAIDWIQLMIAPLPGAIFAIQ